MRCARYPAGNSEMVITPSLSRTLQHSRRTALGSNGGVQRQLPSSSSQRHLSRLPEPSFLLPLHMHILMHIYMVCFGGEVLMKPEADESATRLEGKGKSTLLLTDWQSPAGTDWQFSTSEQRALWNFHCSCRGTRNQSEETCSVQ